MTDEELKAAVKAFMDKHDGDSGKAVELLLSENREYRSKNAKLKATLDEVRGKLPASDALILTSDEGKALEAYRKLGKPEEVAKALDDSKTSAARLAELTEESIIRDTADAYGYKPSVLRRLAKGLTVKVKEEQKDGKPVKTAEVEVDGKPVLLDAYAEANWSEFMPALKPGNGSGNGAGAGTGYVNQSSGGKAPTKDVVQAFIEEQQKKAASKPNPLLDKPSIRTGA